MCDTQVYGVRVFMHVHVCVGAHAWTCVCIYGGIKSMLDACLSLSPPYIMRQGPSLTLELTASSFC